MDSNIKDLIEQVNQNPKEVLSAFSDDPNLRDRVNMLVNMCDIGQDLDAPHSFEELHKIHTYTKDVWLQTDGVALADIQQFAITAINEHMMDAYTLPLVPQKEFINALFNDSTDVLYDALYISATNALEHSEDRNFFDKENDTITWLYYNPDSNACGQFVQNSLSYQQVLEVAAITDKPQNFFYEQLESRAKQELGDINTNEFIAMRTTFLSGKHSLSGISENTMKALIAFAKERDNYLRTAEMGSEQNYNQIDGIINNEPPCTISGYTITDSHIVGNTEFAFGKNEKAPSPYATWQRNIKNDEERADGENWFCGNYFSDKDHAVSDFKERVNDALEEVPAKRPSVKEQLKVFKEMDTQKKVAMQKNKEFER